MSSQKNLGDILDLKHMKARKERVWLNSASDITHLGSLCSPDFTSAIEASRLATYIHIVFNLNNSAILYSL